MFLRLRLLDKPTRRSLLMAAVFASANGTWGDCSFADDWVARQAIDLQVPLTDPKPRRSLPAADLENVPRSTLRFVVPESNYAKPTAPAFSSETAPALQPASEPISKPAGPKVTLNSVAVPSSARPMTPSPHALYGPGPLTTGDDVQPTEKLAGTGTESSPRVATAKSKAAGIIDAEQNEPPIKLDDPQHKARSDEQAQDDVIANDSTLSDGTHPLQRIEVRDLRLKRDGSIDPPSISPRTTARSIANREDDSHQSIGDEVVPDSGDDRQSVGDELTEMDASARSRDRIGPRGDLILGLGLAGGQRVLPETAKLRTPIERTLNYYWTRPENAQERTHWGMFHAVMVYDKDTQILDGKQRYNAVAWMAGNNPCRNDLLFEEDHHGLNVRSGIGLQGHQAQLLAVLGLIDVPENYPIYVGRSKYTVEDIIRREMRDCKSGNELTFTLIGLSHYVDTDSRWVTFDDEEWDFERLIHEELSQPIVGAACGGTHRLMGFAHALRRRRAEGKPLEGQWSRADQYINDFIAYTWELQNRDGSMSTQWFEKPADDGKMDRKVQTTGHIVEFLATALPDDQLQTPKMVHAVSYLVNTLHEERGHEWQIGPKGHALRAIAIYYQRVFGRQDPWRPMSVARAGSLRTR